ncbi:enoyl-CoA hydratase/isomerase family protein [Saccharospirillum salsuginis]|uniref:Methylglutaconyl-CoA hydratase n=1 Tax=Saccharospirillum salsuginis TaxID=418750 RepID=A0A918NJF8_9GAMM|nr:enoyl-CoA hydratase/isomerase family protein [Saccharospirillum salsuginis]GGX72282.1 methylglutaconyl-CoA hydratase [Saccharospirillum salsuginis]
MSALTVTREQGIATLTLNRPEVRNAFGAELIAELTETVAECDLDPEVRVLVLRAEGKHFSAGADLNWMRSMKDLSQAENKVDARKLANLLEVLDGCQKPLVGVCQGAAMGGGVGLLACCDIVLATDNAFFALSEVRIGLSPATISPYVIRAIGARQARRYFVSAEPFDAQRAQAMGLVHEVVATDDLDATLDTLLETLRAGGPEAQQAAKQLVKDVSLAPIDTTLMEQLAERIAAQRVGDEGQEGLAAFLDKRTPAWVKSS